MADNDQRPWTKTERGVLWMLLLLLTGLPRHRTPTS